MAVPSELVSGVVRLRRWRPEDRAPFAAMNGDARVMEFFPGTLSVEQSDAMVERIEAGFERNGFGLWAVEVEGRFAGFTGINPTAFDTPMGPHVEIGWRLAPWSWGHGHATVAARLVVEDAFTRVGLDVLYSFTTERNERSQGVMRRLGMTRRADLDFDHPNTPGWWGQRHVVYRLARADWLAASADDN